MFTICPKCALTLLVTAEDLRVAQGYVRCGRCSSVFNALARLTEERQAPEGAPDIAPGTPPPPREASPREKSPPATSSAAPEPSREEAGAPPPPPPPDVSDEDSIPEDALEFDPSRTDVSKVFVEPPPNPQWSAATGTFRAMMAANQEAMQTPAEPVPPPEETEQVRPRKPDRSERAKGSAKAKEALASPPPPGPPPPPPQASSAVEDDEDIDVEIGPEQLASILRAELAPVPPAAPSREAVAPEPAVPSTPPSATGARIETPAPRPRAPAATVKPPRTRSIEPPAPKESGRPAPGAASPPPPVTGHQGPPPPLTPHQEPPPAMPAQAVAREEAAEADRPRTYARVLRIVRPGAGEQLVPYAWAAGAVVMLLALVAQIVNHNRDELAANPSYNRPLTAIYAALGLHLVPRWDLKAYDVRQLGAAVEPGGSGLITVRASVKNAAPQQQPLPLLRVTLQDRFGNRIAARDVSPQFYLSGNARAFLSAGERIDAEMGFVDPGANAVGFEIDACLPTSGGEVTCANDSAAR